MYEYLPIDQAEAGSVVEAVYNEDGNITKETLYILHENNNANHGLEYIRDDGEPSEGFYASDKYWKLIKTKPGSEAKPGDNVICIENPVDINHHRGKDSVAIGEIKTVQERGVEDGYLYWSDKDPDWYNNNALNWLVLYKAEQKTNKKQKEHKMLNEKSLISLVFPWMEEVKDATNSKFVGVMVDRNGKYVGYTYMDEKKEAKRILRLPENEGNTIHIFEYNTSKTLEPRKVIDVEQNGGK